MVRDPTKMKTWRQPDIPGIDEICDVLLAGQRKAGMKDRLLSHLGKWIGNNFRAYGRLFYTWKDWETHRGQFEEAARAFLKSHRYRYLPIIAPCMEGSAKLSPELEARLLHLSQLLYRLNNKYALEQERLADLTAAKKSHLVDTRCKVARDRQNHSETSALLLDHPVKQSAPLGFEIDRFEKPDAVSTDDVSTYADNDGFVFTRFRTENNTVGSDGREKMPTQTQTTCSSLLHGIKYSPCEKRIFRDRNDDGGSKRASDTREDENHVKDTPQSLATFLKTDDMKTEVIDLTQPQINDKAIASIPRTGFHPKKRSFSTLKEVGDTEPSPREDQLGKRRKSRSLVEHLGLDIDKLSSPHKHLTGATRVNDGYNSPSAVQSQSNDTNPPLSSRPTIQNQSSQARSSTQRSRTTPKIFFFIIQKRADRKQTVIWRIKTLSEHSLDVIFNKIAAETVIPIRKIHRLKFNFTLLERELAFSVGRDDQEFFEKMCDKFETEVRRDFKKNPRHHFEVEMEAEMTGDSEKMEIK